MLRLLVVQHLYDWSYAQTEHFVGDSLVLRQFCRLGLQAVPHHTTLMRWSNLLQPETMHRLLDRVTELGRSLNVTAGGSSHQCVEAAIRARPLPISRRSRYGTMGWLGSPGAQPPPDQPVGGRRVGGVMAYINHHHGRPTLVSI
jgi:transposase-like protein DUF772